MKYLLVWKFKNQPANSMVFTSRVKMEDMYKWLVYHNVVNQLHGTIEAYQRVLKGSPGVPQYELIEIKVES